MSLLPGPATALVVRSAAVHGRRSAFLTVLGNSTGILFWALASVLGISALVAASETAFLVLRVCGAVVLVYLGVRALLEAVRLLDRRLGEAEGVRPLAPAVECKHGFRRGV